MRKRDEVLSKGWGQFVHPLSVDTAGGKQNLNCADTKGLLRIIQSIPSPKAEPFKLWLPTLRKIKRGVLPTHKPTQKHHI
jgi:DNA-damage-inducible protein D